MKCVDLLLGRSLASSEDKKERVGAVPGVSVFGLDAFSSAAYGPEAALTVLIPLGVAGLSFALPITIGITVILFFLPQLPADDCRLSGRRRFLYRCQGEPRRQGRLISRGCADD